MSIDRLKQLLPPPVAPIELGQPDEWLAVEQRLGIALPADYKDYITSFGTGYLGKFLWIFSPFARKTTLNLECQIRVRLDALREIKRQFPNDVPFKAFPESGGLLPCGATGNGDCLYWLTEGAPEKWPILVNESRGPDWVRFAMPLTAFLVGVLRRDIVCEIFPQDFPQPGASFESRS